MTFPAKLYIADIEFEFVDGQESEELAGGCTYAFVKAPDSRVALAMIESSAKKHGLKIVCVESVYPYEGSQWDDEESQAEYDKLAEEAEKSSEPVFDEIWAYREID